MRGFRPGHLRIRRRPRGLGALAILLVVGLILVSLALSSGVHSQGVTFQVHKGVHADLCEELARNAVTEALHRLRQDADRPGTPAFALFRSIEIRTAIVVAQDQLPVVASESRLDPRYALDGGVEVELLRRSLAALEPEERVDYEALGVIRLTARATGPASSFATRVEEYGLRTLLATVPRPFDSPTFFLGDATPLLTRGNWKGDANRAIELAIHRLDEFRRILADVGRGFKDLADRIRQLIEEADESSSEADEALRISEELALVFTQAAADGRYPARPWALGVGENPTDGVPDALHTFHPELTIYSYAAEVELPALDLPTRLAPLTQTLDEDEPVLEESGTAFRTAVESQSPSFPQMAALGRVYLAAILKHVAELDAMLQIYKGFEDSLIEVGGAARDVVVRRFRRFRMRELAWKAQYRFGGPSAVAAATAFLAAAPQKNGVVMIDNPTESLPLRLSGIRGRLVVAASGDVRIQEATVEDPTRDSLVVIAGGGLEIGGPVRAGLVGLSPRLERSGGDLTGSLVLDRLPSGVALDSILAGTLRRMPSLASADDDAAGRRPPDPTRLLARISPEPLYQRTDR